MIKLTRQYNYKYDHFCDFINIENYHKSYFYLEFNIYL